MIVKNGEIIKNGKGEPASDFSSSYLQLPIHKNNGCGIRICLYLQLKQFLSQGFIFTYGHRDNDNIKLSCEHANNQMILVKTNSTNNDLKRVIKVPIDESMKQEPFKLEVALYPKGQLIVAINEWLSKSEKIPCSFNIYDGKLMVGSNLDGEKRGTFLESALTVEAIDNKYRLSDVFINGLMKIGSFPFSNLPPNVLKRPAIIRLNK